MDGAATHGSPPVVVMDNGSSFLRAGYPTESAPRIVAPSLVGLQRNKGVAMAAGMHEFEVGFEAQAQRGSLDCNHPVRGGQVVNWNDMERLWSHVIYKELRIAPENFCFVVGEPTDNTHHNKEQALEVMMETFNAHSLYLGSTAVLALYSYGLTTGVVAECGLHKTQCVPIHEGYPLSRHMTTSEVAGEALTNHLQSLLASKGYGFSTQTEVELVNQVKENLCYVRKDSSSSGNADSSSGGGAGPADGQDGFSLPDDQFIPMIDERHQCPEALFNFGILGDKHVPKCKVFADTGDEFQPSFAKGISWLAYAAINNCESFLQHRLYNSMVLSGGTSLFAGTQQRMTQEVTQLYREMHTGEGLIPINIGAMDCRQYAPWLGGSMLSMISMFPYLTVTRKEYEENGKTIIHCKSL